MLQVLNYAFHDNMENVLIKNVKINQDTCDILINGPVISQIGKNIEVDTQRVIDGSNKAAIPGLVNGHTHAAMTLMRGYADDIPLQAWLETKIWPLEALLTEEDVYWGAKLACLEMIKTGTTTMVDMYHFASSTARAVDEMGIRGMIGPAGFDFGVPEKFAQYKTDVVRMAKSFSQYSSRIQFVMMPHSIYTVSTEMLKWIRDFATDNGFRLHTHLSETETEVQNAMKAYGQTPVEYLDAIGFLGKDVNLAHCLYLTDHDIQILADRKCQVTHAPISNMKLASGQHFRFQELREHGVTVCLGTDGACSNNNLDLFDTMKFAALMGKGSTLDPTVCNADDIFQATTVAGEYLSGEKIGKLEVGYLADITLINLNVPEMTPCFNLTSNIVYAAKGSVVDTVICDGKVVMENRVVPGENEIMEKAAQTAYQLIKRM